MQNKDYILGIDTSNYTTSIAITDRDGTIIADERKLLLVKQGEKGLRQSEAFFQHMNALPELIEAVMKKAAGSRMAGIAVSTRPRPINGSYMPVFKAGESTAKMIAASLEIPLYEYSHQEGHVEAVRYYSEFKDCREFLCFQLSGGTCELLKIKDGAIEIIGGSKDISVGQLLDRIGVGLGLGFPAGKELDQMALNGQESSILKRVALEGYWFNLSGMETKALRNLDTEGLPTELFEKISDLLIRLSTKAVKETNIHNVIFAGGVSESRYIRGKIQNQVPFQAAFGENNLSGDNAVGISLLGGRCVWP